MKKQGSILSDYFSSPHRYVWKIYYLGKIDFCFFGRRSSEPEEDDDVMAPLNDGESESGVESTRNRKRRSRYYFSSFYPLFRILSFP
jgi:hypothetical protein